MDNRNLSTRALAEAGMISALTTVISTIIIYLGFGPPLAVCLIPIPVTILYLRHRFKITLISVLVSTILVSLLSNPINGVTYTLIFGIVGLSLGLFIMKKYSIHKTLALLGLVVSIALSAYFLIYVNLIVSTGIRGEVKEYVKQCNDSIKITKSYSNSASSKESLDQLSKYMNVDTVIKFIPGLIIIAGYLLACLNYIISKKILKKLRYEIKDMIPFSKFYIDSKIGAIIIIMFLSGVILSLKKIVVGEYISCSTGIVLQTILLFQGISVIVYYLKEKYRMSKLLITFIIIIGLFIQLGIFFIALGFADMIIDFRRIYKHNKIEKR